jgi:membrane protein required for beta-lactamase induction
MIIISIVIALVMERVFPQLVEFRTFKWLEDYSYWMKNAFNMQRMGAWMAVAVLLSPLFLLAWMISAMFENALFGLFELAFNVALVFFCIGPRNIDLDVDRYLDAIDVGGAQKRAKLASKLVSGTPSLELSKQALQVCKAILHEANSRVFAVLFWFVLLGPVAALMYRVLEQLLRRKVLEDSLQEIKRVLSEVMGWVDWLPVRFTLFAYMIGGNFDEGLQAYRTRDDTILDIHEENSQLLKAVGFAALVQHPIENDQQAMNMVKKARGLFLRALVVWLILVLFISFLV